MPVPLTTCLLKLMGNHGQTWTPPLHHCATTAAAAVADTFVWTPSSCCPYTSWLTGVLTSLSAPQHMLQTRSWYAQHTAAVFLAHNPLQPPRLTDPLPHTSSRP